MSGQLTGIHGFLDDIARWRRAVGSRAPSYHRLLQEFVALLEGNTPEGVNLANRFQEAWASRTFRIFYERPLLLLAALRMDALVEGTAHPLWSALAAPEPDSENVARGALLDALARDSVWKSLQTQFIQTNETSRAVAWLWPAPFVPEGGALQEHHPTRGTYKAGLKNRSSVVMETKDPEVEVVDNPNAGRRRRFSVEEKRAFG